MAIASWANSLGVLWVPMPTPIQGTNNGSGTMDAAGESQFAMGRVYLSTGIGSSKTLQDGDKIHFRTGAVTWASTTTIRIGTQNSNASGLNDDDWTGEPYGEMVRGTDALTANVVNTVVMSSGGSRVVTHGNQFALGIEMTVRGGTDSVVLLNNPNGMPYGVADTGSGPAKITGCSQIAIEFADGTIGMMGMDNYPNLIEASASFASNSTPDEYGLLFQVPFPVRVNALYARLASMAATDDFELILYSDPLGTPAAMATVAVDADLLGFATHYEFPIAATADLAANTNYVIAVRPTTTNAIQINRLNFGTGNGELRAALSCFGTTASQVTRTDNTGAFGSSDVTLIPLLGFRQQGGDDGTGGGGGSRGFGMTGGMS